MDEPVSNWHALLRFLLSQWFREKNKLVAYKTCLLLSPAVSFCENIFITKTSIWTVLVYCRDRIWITTARLLRQKTLPLKNVKN